MTLVIPVTLTLNLPPEITQYLTDSAIAQGLSTEDYTIQVLRERLPLPEKSQQLIDLLQSWIDEPDDGEQRSTGEYLIQVLDEDRTSDRLLFPAELKGISW
jgi:hypothetical protein